MGCLRRAARKKEIRLLSLLYNMWYSWLHSCPVEYGALLRSHSKRSIGHNGSICFLMKCTSSLIRLCCDRVLNVQIRLYIIYFGSTFGSHVYSVTLNTSKVCRVGRVFEQLPAFCRQECNVGWGEMWKVCRRRVCVLHRGWTCCPQGGLQSCRSPRLLARRPPLDAARPAARG